MVQHERKRVVLPRCGPPREATRPCPMLLVRSADTELLGTPSPSNAIVRSNVTAGFYSGPMYQASMMAISPAARAGSAGTKLQIALPTPF